MNVEQTWVELEDRTAEWKDSLFRNYDGLDIPPNEIERQADAVRVLAKKLASAARHDRDAWSFLSGIIRASHLFPIELEINAAEERHYTFSDILLDGRPVTPYTWKRYLYEEDDRRSVTRSSRGLRGTQDFVSLYHEMGHALHYVSIDPTLPYWTRTGITAGVAETFSFWMEGLVSDPLYLAELGLKESAAGELVRFEQLVRATFATWLTLQALVLLDYWILALFSRDTVIG